MIERRTYYVIRHKPTNQLMPMFKSHKGYSEWNPWQKSSREHSIPRIFGSVKFARRSILSWLGEVKYDLIKPKLGFPRNEYDLEIVPVTLTTERKSASYSPRRDTARNASSSYGAVV